MENLLSGFWFVGYFAIIMLVSSYLRKTGALLPFFRWLFTKIKSKRALVAIISCVAGVLPVTGRAAISAGVLNTIAPKNNRQVYGIIDYLSTHHYYFWSPLEKTVILPMAVLGISYGTFLGLIAPLLVTALAVTLFYIFYVVKEEQVEIEIPEKAEEDVEWINWKALIAVAIVIIIGNYLKSFEWVLGNTELVAGLFMSFIFAFILGSSGKFAGFVSLLTSIYGIKWLPLFFAVDYAGYMLSPAHKCLHISRGYFGTTFMKFYKAVGIFTGLIILSGLFSTGLRADYDERIENNYKVKFSNGITVGGRRYLDYDANYTHDILRWDIDKTNRLEYRYTKKRGEVKHWYRYQHKDWKKGCWFYNSRYEYRDQPDRDYNVFRYRPQMGCKQKFENKAWRFYYILEPQIQWSGNTHDWKFSHAQHFLGVDFKITDKLEFGPFIEIDTDDSWQHERWFVGTELNYKF